MIAGDASGGIGVGVGGNGVAVGVGTVVALAVGDVRGVDGEQAVRRTRRRHKVARAGFMRSGSTRRRARLRAHRPCPAAA
jgi:hypothetical protein